MQEKIDVAIVVYINQKLPHVIFWEYQAKYLLPSEISYDDFITNDKPAENSAPLYNILLLSKPIKINDFDQLKKKISTWKLDSSERRKDSRIITESLNTYVKSIWTDYDQDLNIELEESKITIHVNDPNSLQKNFYDMQARSQGFKTFISFMLTIAAEAENGQMRNFILLLDEPETHLHPSGARYMKDELFKLSDQGNCIVYATHSIFMIDRNNLRRHVIISKENELTRITRVERNNFIQEAVLYEAMGTQVDEFSIGTQNIVFEGGLDLQMFSFYINKCLDKTSYKEIQEYDLWDGGGVKRIEQFFVNKILPKGSIWYLILDNDNPGIGLAKSIDTKFKGDVNCTLTNSHYSSVPNFELEDALPRSLVRDAFMEAAKEITFQYDVDFLKDQRLVSEITNEFKNRHKLTKEQGNLFEKTFKDELDKNVMNELGKIEKENASKKDRLESFKIGFELYFSFANDFVTNRFYKNGIS